MAFFLPTIFFTLELVAGGDYASLWSNRPKDFDTKDTMNVVFTFERVKEDKKR